MISRGGASHFGIRISRAKLEVVRAGPVITRGLLGSVEASKRDHHRELDVLT